MEDEKREECVVRFNYFGLNVIYIKDTVKVEYNTGDEDIQYLRVDQHGSGKLRIWRNSAVRLKGRHNLGCASMEKVEKVLRIRHHSKRKYSHCSEKRFVITLRWYRSAIIIRNLAKSRTAGRSVRRQR